MVGGQRSLQASQLVQWLGWSMSLFRRQSRVIRTLAQPRELEVESTNNNDTIRSTKRGGLLDNEGLQCAD